MIRARKQDHIFSQGLKVMLRRDQFTQHLYGSDFLASIAHQHGRIKGLGGDGSFCESDFKFASSLVLRSTKMFQRGSSGCLAAKVSNEASFARNNPSKVRTCLSSSKPVGFGMGKNRFSQRKDRIVALRTQRGLERGFHQCGVALGFRREGG